MQLETERLVLRLPRLEDAEPFLALYSDPVAMEFIGGVHPEVAADPAYPVRAWLARWEKNGMGPFVAERREDGVVVGRAGFHVGTRGRGTCRRSRTRARTRSRSWAGR